MGLLYSIQKHLFRFIGDIKWSGVTRPFWFTINAVGYQLKGEHYRKLIKILQPGDLLARRFEGYVDKWFIPGYWNHMGIYIGDDGDRPEQVIHAVSEGVIQEDVLNFMRTDHMAVLRPDSSYKEMSVDGAVKKAKAIVGKPYDFGFDFRNTDRFSCTELTAYCYPNIVHGKKRLGKSVIVADDFFNSEKLNAIWDSRHIQSQPVVESFLASRCPVKKA